MGKLTAEDNHDKSPPTNENTSRHGVFTVMVGEKPSNQWNIQCYG